MGRRYHLEFVNYPTENPVFVISRFSHGARQSAEMPGSTEDEVARHLGAEPGVIAKDLRAFTDAAKVLSSDHPRLIDAYPMQWVAVYEGRVVAHSADMAEVLRKLEEQAIPLASAIIRFIEKEEPALVL